MILQNQVRLALQHQRYALALEEIKLKRSIDKMSKLLNTTTTKANQQFLKTQLAQQKKQLKMLRDMRAQNQPADRQEKL